MFQNHEGGDESERPTQIEGQVSWMQEQAEEMRSRIFQCQSYDSALSIIGDYVNITAKEQSEELSMEMN